MKSIADGSIIVQASSQSVPSTPPWFGEVALIVQYLRKHHILSALTEQVRFARRRFGHYEVIDFLAVLFGYALSGERTLEAFYEHLSPFASADHWHFSDESVCLHAPHSVAFSRLCLKSPSKLCAPCFSLICWLVLWGRRSSQQDCGIAQEAAGRSSISMEPVRPLANALYRHRPRARLAPQRRLRPLCAPGSTFRKRGEVVRSRTTILQAHTHQWFGSFGGPGNGKSREELRRAVAQIQQYLVAHQLSAACVLLRLDGLYGTGATFSDVAGLAVVMRGKDYQVLSQAQIQFRLSLPPDQQFSRPESAHVA